MRGWLVILIFIGLRKAIFSDKTTNKGTFQGGKTSLQDFSGCTYPGHGPNSMTNLLTSNKERFNAGEVAVYTCDPGFELYGPEQRTCLCDGTWTEEIPFCGNDVDVYIEAKDDKGACGESKSNQKTIVYFLYPERGGTIMINLYLKNKFIPDTAIVEYSFARRSSPFHEENRSSASLKRRQTGEMRDKGDAYFYVDTKDFEGYFLKIKVNPANHDSDAFKINDVHAIELAGNVFSWCSLEYYQNGGYGKKEARCAEFYKDVKHNEDILPEDQYCKLFVEEGEIEACIFTKNSNGFKDKGHPQCNYYKDVTSYDKNMSCNIYSAMPDHAEMHSCKEGFISCYKGMYGCGFPSQNPETMTKFSGNGRELKVTYRCPKGNYDLMGPEERTCNGNGKWTGVAPSCVFALKAKSSVDDEHESKHEAKDDRDSRDVLQSDFTILERVVLGASTVSLLVWTSPLVYVLLTWLMLMVAKCVYKLTGIQRKRRTLKAKSKPKKRNETEKLLSLDNSKCDYNGGRLKPIQPIHLVSEGSAYYTTFCEQCRYCDERKHGAHRAQRTKERGFNQQPRVEEDEETYTKGKWHYL